VSDSALPGIEEAEAVLDARRELYGDDNTNTVNAMLTLARVWRDAGENRKAEHLLREALAVQRRLFGEQDPSVVRTEFSLAVVVGSLGETDVACRMWRHVVAVSDALDGPASDLSRSAAVNLAITLRELKRYGDEFPVRQRILDETRARVGEEDLETYRALADLALVQHNLGNYEIAFSLHETAIAGFERSGVEARSLLLRKWTMAEELVQLQRPEEASALFEQLRADAAANLPPDDPLRRRIEKHKKALSLLRKIGAKESKVRSKRKRST
jgi:tetratricopeptide (TPR) repeat protein